MLSFKSSGEILNAPFGVFNKNQRSFLIRDELSYLTETAEHRENDLAKTIGKKSRLKQLYNKINHTRVNAIVVRFSNFIF